MRLISAVSTAFACLRLTAAQEQVVLDDGHDRAARPVNIAIIGAGAAGASSAYHLSQFAKVRDLPINITVFERNPYVGGRSTTVNAYDDPDVPVELGASIFVQVNSILVNAANEFNLSTSSFRAEQDDIPGASLGIWNGETFVFTQTGAAGGWWDIAKLVWRYGIAPVRTMRLMKTVVGKFLDMYNAPVFPFASLTQAAQDVGLLAVTAATGEQYMLENGITGLFGAEIVQASTRVNYAQNLPYIHGLEAMVCMATDGAMSVEGGNWRIFDNMIRASKAVVLMKTAVTGVEKHGDGSFDLRFRSSKSHVDGEETETLGSQRFDSVILAAPYQYSNLTFSLPAPETPDQIPYVQLHVTLFTSSHLLSPSFFNLPADQATPKVILTTIPNTEMPRRGPDGVVGSPGFFSISLLQPVTNPSTGNREYLYKIFSPDPPSLKFLSSLLGVTTPRDTDMNDDEAVGHGLVTWIHRKVWNSYPYEFPRVTFEDPQRDGWYYTGGMDSFISTMETNALMGRNVAALVAREWDGKRRTSVSSENGEDYSNASAIRP